MQSAEKENGELNNISCITYGRFLKLKRWLKATDEGLRAIVPLRRCVVFGDGELVTICSPASELASASNPFDLCLHHSLNHAGQVFVQP